MRESYVKLAVDVDQSALLECRARAWPRPTITWFRNYTSLAVSDRNKYSVSEPSRASTRVSGRASTHVSQLTINNVQQDDLGVYSCTARNDFAANVTDFNLSVKSKSVAKGV